MTNQDNQITNYRGRAGGLIAAWKETGRERKRIWVNTCPMPGWGRMATLNLLREMVVQNDHVPGSIQSQQMGRGLAGNGMGGARARNPGPCPRVADPPL